MAQHISSFVDNQSARSSKAADAPYAEFSSPFRLGKSLSERWGAKLLLILAGTIAGLQIDFWAHGGTGFVWNWANVGVYRHSLLVGLLHSFIYSTNIGLLLFYSFSLCGAYISRRRFPLKWALLFLAIIVPTVIGTMLSGLSVIVLCHHPLTDYPEVTIHSLHISLLLSFIFGISFYLYENLKGELEATAIKLHHKQLEEERARKLTIAAQLSSLESRVRPHFLFNTLNSISALIRENPERAERMVGHLSALLRFSLGADQLRTVTLCYEIKLVKDYLEIEKARFNSRLRFSIDIPADLNAVAVPPFALQTLVENSVKYAVASRRSGGEIRIAARAENDTVKLVVKDDGPGFTAEAITAGHGLDNLQARLAALYDDQGSLDIEADDRSTAVIITLPRGRSADVT